MLQRNVDVGANLFVRRNRIQQPAGDLVGIRVEKADPTQFIDFRKPGEQQSETVFDAEIFAVARCVLTNQSQLSHPIRRQTSRLCDDRFEMP